MSGFNAWLKRSNSILAVDSNPQEDTQGFRCNSESDVQLRLEDLKEWGTVSSTPDEFTYMEKYRHPALGLFHLLLTFESTEYHRRR
jgi:hypothetical protein